MEQTVATWLSKTEQLSDEMEQVKAILGLQKENSNLRAQSSNFNQDTLEEVPVCSTSATKPFCHTWQTTCDEGEFSKGLQPTENKQETRTSSPADFKSFLQSSMHTDGNGKVELQAHQLDNSLDIQDADRFLGEISFQLNQRILSYVFVGQRRFYGFTLLNIPDKITQFSTHPLTGKVDEGYHLYLTQRYTDIMRDLSMLGYKTALHPQFTEFIINSFGALRKRTSDHSRVMLFNNPEFLRNIVMTKAPKALQKDLLLVLSCLCSLADRDGKPLLLW